MGHLFYTCEDCEPLNYSGGDAKEEATWVRRRLTQEG